MTVLTDEIDRIVDQAIESADATISPLQRFKEPNVTATATLDLTTDIVLTASVTGAARNAETLTLEVIAAAANPTDKLLAAWSGTEAAMILTITPNDGTNNTATPVTFTTAELVEYLNTGDIAAKTGQVTESGTDAAAFRALQSAAGGDTTVLANGGEGDSKVATFANGETAYDPVAYYLGVAAAAIKVDLKD